MSASMAEVIQAHAGHYGATDPDKDQWTCRCIGCKQTILACDYGSTLSFDAREKAHAEHVEVVLAANGYGKLEDAWEEGWLARWPHHDDSDANDHNPYRRPE